MPLGFNEAESAYDELSALIKERLEAGEHPLSITYTLLAQITSLGDEKLIDRTRKRLGGAE